ncbi:MAG: NAD-dependent succinate-semialdehyde dehydrogenase [Firmicutes bacterium]|nr:NAD-dependent succinate-semialdehyde dehydrogenase [Bacillota bacterium]
MLIDGQWVEAADGRQTSVINPATGESIASVPVGSTQDVDRAVEAANAVFPKWAETAPKVRAQILREAGRLARSRRAELARLLTMEQGKPLKEAEGEIDASIDALEYYAEEARRIYGEIYPTDKRNRRSLIIKQPVGPVAAIGPWNYPVLLLSWKVAPALAAGCTVVAKPSSITPLAVTAFLACLQEAGLPPGVLNIVIGSGSEVGRPLVQHRLIRKIAMTGQTNTGKEIMRAAADGLKRISLELGGHCPLIVAPDADLEQAAKGAAYRAFRNMGQICNAVNRIYVHEAVYDPFVERIVEEARRLRIGNGLDDDVDLGPMTTEEGPETCRRHVRDAVNKGARVAYGGKEPEGEQYANGYFFMPTVLTECHHGMAVMREETFGPLAPVMKVRDLDEAIRLANDSPYGLVAYVYTQDLKTAFEVSERLECGTVGVNNVSGGEVAYPYGGWKESGIGLELSAHGLEEYLLIKHIRIDLL